MKDYDQIDNAPEEKKEVLQLHCFSHFYETDKKTLCMHVDCL